MTFRRVILVVCDSLGVGALPDAQKFGDTGSNTLLNTDQFMKGLKIPNFQKMGLLNLINHPQSATETRSFFGRMIEISQGKDTTTGHWEMMGLPLEVALHHFPDGFPTDLMKAWSAKTGLGFLGNKAASGTTIIEELGEEHLKNLDPIVYTSADSVFQIAAHEELFGLERLYAVCEATRKFLDQSAYKVGRVIARPFIGKPGSFKRTGNRRDFSLKPPSRTHLCELKDAGVQVLGVGKIPYIYDFEGISQSIEAHNDAEAVTATIKALEQTSDRALIFVNLNDLDMLYGHRRDTQGYGKQIEWIDSQLGNILKCLTREDLIILTADHGNDPTFRGTDHTREYVPLLIDSPAFARGSATQHHLADRQSFSDLGATIAQNFGIRSRLPGKSFLKEILAA